MLTIVLRAIEFEGRHGATAIERKSLRKFQVDMEVDVDGDSGRSTNRLADTVNYADLAETIVHVGTGEPVRLLESLAHRMLEALQEQVPSGRFRLEVRKLHPPSCPGHPAYSAVRVQSRT